MMKLFAMKNDTRSKRCFVSKLRGHDPEFEKQFGSCPRNLAPRNLSHRNMSVALPRFNDSGFTLIEMLIALAVFAIVMASVYTVMSVGLRAGNNGGVENEQNARAAIDGVSSQLRMAFLIPGMAMYNFDGSGSTISFFIIPAGAKNPVRVEYYVGDNSKGCSGLCRKTYNDPLNPNAAAPAEEPVAPAIKTLKFEYSDGNEWLPAWSTPSTLPALVRVNVGVKSAKGTYTSYETIVGIPAAAESKLTPVILPAVVPK